MKKNKIKKILETPSKPIFVGPVIDAKNCGKYVLNEIGKPIVLSFPKKRIEK